MFYPTKELFVEQYKGIEIYKGGHTLTPYMVAFKGKTYGAKSINQVKEIIDFYEENDKERRS